MPSPRTAKTKTAAKEPDDSADQRAAAAASDEPEVKGDPELTPEEYLTHRAEVLARLPEEKDRPKNIYARLAQINGFIGVIRKTGVNDFHKYTFAKESDLVEEIRPMLSEYGIWIEQGLHADPELGLIAHQRLPQYKARDQVTIDSLTVITKRFRFVWWNPESGALETTEWEPFMGYGDDTGDKGYYKAETGAVKYFLMKTFMIATGNDPEADAAVDRRADQRGAGGYQGGGQGGQRPTRASGQPAAPGGRQQESSQPQQRAIGELLRAAGAKSTMDAIKLIEEVTGDKVAPIKGQEDDLAAALTAHLAGLSGPKSGALAKALRSIVDGKAKEPTGGDGAESGEGEQHRPAAAGYTDDEAQAPGGDAKVWSEQSEEQPAADSGSDGAIDSAID